MPVKRVVYDLSGEEPVALERFAVVAKELVAVDPKRFAFEIPTKKPKAAEEKK